MRRSRLFAITIGLVLTALGPSTVAAGGRSFPLDFTVEYQTSALCPFPVEVVAHVWGRGTDHYDAAGNWVGVDVSVREQDSFTAIGSLTTEVYAAHASIRVDGTTETRNRATGVLMRTRLPDGSLFLSAGHFSWLNHPDLEASIVPDVGHAGNVDAFCDALDG